MGARQGRHAAIGADTALHRLPVKVRLTHKDGTPY